MYKNIEAIATAGNTSPTKGTKMLGKNWALIEIPLIFLAKICTKNFVFDSFPKIFNCIFLTKIEKIGIDKNFIFGKGKSKSKNEILTHLFDKT